MLSVLSTIAKVGSTVKFCVLKLASKSSQTNVGQTSMLLAATESIGQAKWLLYRKEGRDLIDFHTIDEASRGPWGAFQLLYRFWDGRTILASAGAFVVLTSLAVDPFTQQILSYPSISNITSAYDQPIFPRVSSWNTSGSVVRDSGQNSDISTLFPNDR